MVRPSYCCQIFQHDKALVMDLKQLPRYLVLSYRKLFWIVPNTVKEIIISDISWNFTWSGCVCLLCANSISQDRKLQGVLTDGTALTFAQMTAKDKSYAALNKKHPFTQPLNELWFPAQTRFHTVKVDKLQIIPFVLIQTFTISLN